MNIINYYSYDSAQESLTISIWSSGTAYASGAYAYYGILPRRMYKANVANVGSTGNCPSGSSTSNYYWTFVSDGTPEYPYGYMPVALYGLGTGDELRIAGSAVDYTSLGTGIYFTFTNGSSSVIVDGGSVTGSVVSGDYIGYLGSNGGTATYWKVTSSSASAVTLAAPYYGTTGRFPARKLNPIAVTLNRTTFCAPSYVYATDRYPLKISGGWNLTASPPAQYLQEDGSTAKTYFKDTSSSLKGVVLTTCRSVEISDLVMASFSTSFSSTYTTASYDNGCFGIKYSNCAALWGTYGFLIDTYCGGNSIDSCYVIRNNYGVRYNYTSLNTITDCTICDCGVGFYGAGTAGGHIKDCKMLDTELLGNGTSFSLSYGINYLMQNCEVAYATGTTLLTLNTDSGTTITADMHDNTSTAISATNSRDIYIKNTGTGAAAISTSSGLVGNCVLDAVTYTDSTAIKYSTTSITTLSSAGSSSTLSVCGQIAMLDGTSDGTLNHTPSGYVWKLTPSQYRTCSSFPLSLHIGEVAVSGGSEVQASIWVKRPVEDIDVHARLATYNSSLGIGSYDYYIDLPDPEETDTEPTGWKLLCLTFTPAVAGVYGFDVLTWSDASSTPIYVDDFLVRQL